MRQASTDLGGRVRVRAHVDDQAHPQLALSLPPLSYAVLAATITPPRTLPLPEITLDLPKPGTAGYAQVRLAGPTGAAAARGQVTVTVRFMATAADGRRIWWDPAERAYPEAVALTAEVLLPDGRIRTVTAPLAPPAMP